MLLTLVALAGGVVLLAVAADQFVVGAARIATARRIPPLVVGVVVLGFGTSSPELLVSVLAAADGDLAVAVGNVLGSNVANLSLLLGTGALVCPIVVTSAVVRREVPLTLAAMAALWLVVQEGLARVEGVALVVAMAGVLWWLLRTSTASEAGQHPDDDALAVDVRHAVDVPTSTGREVVRTVLGLVGTVAGAQLLLSAALDLAARAGLEAGFVGATLVAVGTSLPELVTVVQSARRGETDLVVGNLLGSNLFNALGVAGVVGLVGPAVLDDPALTTVAAGGATLVAAVAAVAMWTGLRVGRREGALLVAAYAALIPLLA